MKNLILMSVLIAFSFSVNANELKIKGAELIMKNPGCDSLGQTYGGHLVNRSDKRIEGALCFDFYDSDDDHMRTCGGTVDLKAKKGDVSWRTSILRYCRCDKSARHTWKFLENGSRADCY